MAQNSNNNLLKLKSLITFILFLLAVQTLAWIDPDAKTFETIECNKIYPFAFKTLADTSKIVDWDISTFTNYFSFNQGSQYQTTEDQKPYTALLFIDNTEKNKYVGVSYEVERAFRWLKLITDSASSSDVGSISIYSQSGSTYQPYTSQQSSLRKNELNDIIIVLYELDKERFVIAQFGYLQGELIKAQKVKKTGSWYANQISSKVVWNSPTENINTEKRIHFVIGNKYDAQEIQMSVGDNSVIKRSFSYKESFQINFNSDSLQIVGISSIRYNVDQKNDKDFSIWNQNYYSTCKITTGHENQQKQTDYNYSYGDFTNMYLNELQQRTTQYYYATALLTDIQNNDKTWNNTIYWFVSGMTNSEQELRQYKYSFDTKSKLTSYVASHDAPGLCMTSFKDGTTHLFLDEMRMMKQFTSYYISGKQTECNEKPDKLVPTDYKWSISLKNFTLTSDFQCRAINTPSEQLHMNWQTDSSNLKALKEAVCFVHTVFLLSQSSTDNPQFYLVHLKFKRSDLSFYDEIKSEPSLEDFNCESYTGILYSGNKYFQFSKFSYSDYSNYVLSAKAYLNVGFTIADQKMNPISDPHFYFGIYQNGVTKRISVETNNVKIRQMSINSSSKDSVFKYATEFTQKPTAYNLSDYIPKLMSELDYKGTDFPNQKINLVSKQLWDNQYDWTINTRPKVLMIDPKVQTGTFCLEIKVSDPFIMNQITLAQQGKHVEFSDSGYPVTMDMNLWPYSNCKDRSFKHNIAPSLSMTDFFQAKIVNPTVILQKGTDLLIKIEKGNSPDKDKMYLQILPDKRTLGLQKSLLQIQFSIGVDSINKTWSPRLQFLESCQAKKQIWQVPARTSYPATISVVYDQNQTLVQLPPLVISNPSLYLYDIDTKVRLQPITYTVYVNGTAENKTRLELFDYQLSFEEDKLAIAFTNGVEDKSYTVWIEASCLTPYFSINSNNELQNNYYKVKGQLYNINVLLSRPPQFEDTPLVAQNTQNAQSAKTTLITGIKVKVGQPMVYTLPKVVVEDGSQAYILSISSTPRTKIVSLIQSKDSSNNQIKINPTQASDAGTYTVSFLLQSKSIVPQFAMQQMKIEVLPVELPQVIKVQPAIKNQNKTNSNYSLSLNKINTFGEAFFTFSLMTNSRFLRDVVSQTNMTEILQNYVTITHQQRNLATNDIISLPSPSFNVTQFNGVDLVMKVNFPNAELLSSSLRLNIDILKFEFNTSVFTTMNNQIASASSWEVQLEMPIQQISKSDQELAAIQLIEDSAPAFKGVLTSSFVVNLLMSTTITMLWGTINIMQLVLHIPLINVILPDSAYLLCASLLSLMNFELYDPSDLNNYFLGDDSLTQIESQPRNDRLDLAGYTDMNFIYNLGTAFHMILLLFIFATIFILVHLVNSIIRTKCLFRLESVLIRVVSIPLWTRIFLESNMQLIVAGCLQIEAISTDATQFGRISILLAIISLLLALVIPFITFVIIRRLFLSNQISHKHYVHKYSELYHSQLHQTPKLSQVSYNTFFMVRRIFSACCLLYLDQIVGLQIGLQLFGIVMWTGYVIETSPFENPSLNQIDVFNNICYWLCTACCYGMTEICDSKLLQSVVGLLFVFIVAGMLFLNMLFMFVTVLTQLYRKCKKSYLVIRHKYPSKFQKVKKTPVDIKITQNQQQNDSVLLKLVDEPNIEPQVTQGNRKQLLRIQKLLILEIQNQKEENEEVVHEVDQSFYIGQNTFSMLVSDRQIDQVKQDMRRKISITNSVQSKFDPEQAAALWNQTAEVKKNSEQELELFTFRELAEIKHDFEINQV